ncbi:MAG: winged helix-turn-helix domain-containing protein [Bacteroidota bacterium]
MGRTRQTEIKESLSTLDSYKQKALNYKASKKLDLLLLISTDTYGTLEEIATHLSISIATLHRWLYKYRAVGINQYLSPEIRDRNSKLITPDIHRALADRLHDPEKSFNGFKDAQDWLKQEFGLDIEYQWLWKYMTTKLEAKLKVPRKTNVHKDEEASADFFKTTVSAEGH